MMKRRLFLFLAGIFIFPAWLSAQDLDARSPKPTPSTQKQRKAEKKKDKQKKELSKAIEKGKKRHLSYQDRKTKKMMKKSKRRSGQWNDNRKDFFLKRWFSKKRR